MTVPQDVGAKRRHPSGFPELLQLLALAAAYVVVAKIGFRAALVAEQVSPVWPATGLALWAALYFGSRAWPAVWLGAFAANATTHVPFLAASSIATGNMLEAIVGAWLLRRLGGVDYSLERLRHMSALILGAAVASTAISTTIGVTTLCLAGLQPWSHFGWLGWMWWLGDATGALLFAPLLLTARMWRTKGFAVRLGEFLALTAATTAICLFVFVVKVTPLTEHHPLEYTVFPLVIWAGLRFAHPGAAVINAIISSIAVWGTLHGTGPFTGSSLTSPQESIILLQIYTAVIATSGLVLGAATADRHRSERLRQTDHTLTAVLAKEPNLRGAAQPLLKAVCETLEWDVGILWQTNDERQVLEFVDSWQRDESVTEFVAVSRAREFPPGLGLPGRVWSAARPVWIYDVVVDSNFPRSPVAARLALHGAFGFPILLGDKVLGVMEFFARQSRRVDDSLLTLMAAAGSQIGQFIERSRAQQRVTESEALNSAIVNAALDCVITIDGRGCIVEFNPAASHTFGFSRDQAVGQELAQFLVPERLRDRHREALRRCVETGEARILGKRIEMPARRDDGSEITVELAITRVGSLTGPLFTAHLRDITDRKRHEAERAELLVREQRARREAEAANRSKDEFLATVSHELRTPLTAIVGWAAMLKNMQFDRDRLQQIHESIYRNAQAQAQIVNDLLDVSRIVTGRLRLDVSSIDICEIVRLGIETIRPTATVKDVTLDADIPESCTLSGDQARLQQVVWNLLSNAVKFTPSGGRVAVAVRPAGSCFEIEVRDTGIGIGPALLPHVFERFWQADSTPTRTHGGLGLGLALVRHIVELHGGEVQATSEGETRGSTFTVRLPARLHQPPASTAARSKPTAADLQAVTALIVDDDAAARELFAAILEGHGAQVECAESAAEAMGLARGRQAQVMIIDIGMPEEDGMTLLRRIRAHETSLGLPHIPAIAVTAYAGLRDRDRALQAGFTAHLPKPILPHDLVSAILKAVRS